MKNNKKTLDIFLNIRYTIKRAKEISKSEAKRRSESQAGLQMWRNWHTRMIQVHVRVNWVRVQVPPSA